MLTLVAILAVAPSSVSLDPLRCLGDCTGYGSMFDQALREEGRRLNLQLWMRPCDHLRNVLKRNCHQIVQSMEDFIVCSLTSVSKR
jgi:hypothetical protein